jgi:quinol-cytochrome oxidoreductase complex cytochrome b subunit
MAVDYRRQYRPDQLEPFWPNEIMKMGTAVLCTLAVIMIFAILPVVLDTLGLQEMLHTEEPADPRGTTPVGIKPEWYFLASYQILRLMPTALLGISGKTLGVLTQAALGLVILLLPFWYRRGAHRRPGWTWRLAVTAVLVAFAVLTIWGGWPAAHGPAGEQPVSLGTYLRERLVLFAVLAIAAAVFYALIAQERSMIRKTLHAPPPGEDGGEGGTAP